MHYNMPHLLYFSDNIIEAPNTESQCRAREKKLQHLKRNESNTAPVYASFTSVRDREEGGQETISGLNVKVYLK